MEEISGSPPKGDMTDNGPRLIGRKEAAAYCGITPTAFSLWVGGHKMPPALATGLRQDANSASL